MNESAAVDLGIDGIGPAIPLAAGGFAQVYTAEQTSFRRMVAVKVLFASELNSDAYTRFERECHALGAVSDHPNIVVVHDRGSTDSGFPYIIMELRKGGSLAERLKTEGSMTSHEVIGLGVKIGRALSVAHGAKVLHRDVKPANILLSTYGEPALADFGIARIEGGNKTTSGKFTASIAHAPPEVLRGEEPNETSDIYSLASSMFELFVGHAPYTNHESDSVWLLMNRIMNEPTPNPRSFGMPDAMASILERALTQEAEERYTSAASFVSALESLKLESAPVATASYLSNKAPSITAEPRSSQVGKKGSGGLDRPGPAANPDERVTAAGNAAKTTATGPVAGKKRPRGGLFVGFALGLVVVGLAAAFAALTFDPLNVTAELSIAAAEVGPLEPGKAYAVVLTNSDSDDNYQLIVDGKPVGSVGEGLPFYTAEPGRHSLQVEVDGKSDERTNAVEVYGTPELSGGAFRANLASVSQKRQDWSAAVSEYDRLVASGHTGLKIVGSEDGVWWRFFIDGFAEREVAQDYCNSFGLAVEKCFVGVL